MTAQITDAAAALSYITAGRATVTLVSRKTSARYTYSVKAAKDGGAHFVSLLSGADNTGDYTYLGLLRGGEIRTTAKSAVSADAPSYRAIAWALRQLAHGSVPEQLEIWHEGKCGRCGRKLTVPESIASGLGPTCAGK